MRRDNTYDSWKDWFHKKMKRWKVRTRVDARKDHDLETKSPFTQEILDDAFPMRFLMPMIEVYKGNMDLKLYVEKFELLMQIQWMIGEAVL